MSSMSCKTWPTRCPKYNDATGDGANSEAIHPSQTFKNMKKRREFKAIDTRKGVEDRFGVVMLLVTCTCVL